MQKKAIYGVFLLVVMLAMASLSCALTGGGEPAAEAPTAAPTAEMPATAVETPADSPSEPESVPADTDTEQPAEAPTEESAEPVTTDEQPAETSAEAPQFEGLAIDSVFNDPTFESYQFAMNMTFNGTDTDGNTIDQTMNFTIIHTENPQATTMTMSGMGLQGMEEGFDNMNITQIGDTTYMIMAEIGCMTLPSTGDDMFAENPMANMLDDAVLDDLDNATYEGQETINGVNTHHYSFDESNMPDADEVEWVDGHIYLAVDGGYLVRMIMNGEGVMDMSETGGDNGELYLEINLTDVNQPIEITVPADCETTEGGSSEYPMMEDAFEVSSFPGLVSYKTAATPEDVVAFYEQALPTAGWEYLADSSFSAGGNSMLNYQQDGENLSLTIGPDTTDPTITFVVILGE